MKTIILCITLLIILTACAVPNRNMAGRIENREISLQEFMGAYRGHFENFMFEYGRRPDNDDKKKLERDTWRHIAMHVILSNHFEKYDIRSSEQEVLDTLSLRIPAYIRTSPLFQTDGKFDKDLYIQSLNFNTPVDLTLLKRQYFEYYIPVQKLKQNLIETVLLSKAEQRLIKRIINTRADVDWVIFDPKDHDVMISDSDIESFYQANLRNYSQEPYFVLEYITIPVKVSQSDITQAAADIASVYQKLLSGENFGALARQYSTAITAANGGDLGFVRVSDSDLAIRKLLDATPSGSFTAPLEASGKWIIHKVEDRTKSFYKLHEIVIEPLPSSQTIESSRTNETQRVLELTRRFGAQTAASELGWQYHKTNPLGRDSLWIKDTAIMNAIRENITEHKAGHIFEPMYSRELQSWMVIVMTENQSRQFKQLDQVRPQIVKELMDSRRSDLTRQVAGRWMDAFRSNSYSYPSGFKAKVMVTTDASYDLQILGKPARSLFFRVMQDHYNKNRIEPYTFDELIVVPIIKKTRILKVPATDLALVRDLFIENLDPDWFDQWMEKQLRSARIQIRYGQQ